MIDYEDVALGYASEDIAVVLFYYRYDERFDFEEVKKNFYSGYESVRALPEFTERELEIFMLARRLNFMNYILLVSDDPKAYIERNVKRIQEVVKSLGLEIRA